MANIRSEFKRAQLRVHVDQPSAWSSPDRVCALKNISDRYRSYMTTLGDTAGRQEIVDRIAQLSVSDKAIWGLMSAHQMVCHLADAYRVP
jgi:hypothetical protein